MPCRFLRLQLDGQLTRRGDEMGWEADQLQSWRRCFRADHNVYSFTDEASTLDDADMFVLSDAVYIGECLLVSDATWKPLAHILDLLGEVPADGNDEQRRTTGCPASAFDDRIFECPWVNDYWENVKKLDSAMEESSTESDDGKPREEPVFEVDVAALDDSLATTREAWRHRDAFRSTDFKWALLGGKWLAERRGIMYDAFEATARKGGPMDFCVRWHLPRSSSYFCSIYTEAGSFTLATAWCHKMQWLYSKFVAEGEAVDYGKDAMARYDEPDGIEDLYRTGTPRMRTRIKALRELTPRR